jgi:hypothetical protein
MRRWSRCRRVLNVDVSGGSHSCKQQGQAKGKDQSEQSESRGHFWDSLPLLSPPRAILPSSGSAQQLDELAIYIK